LDQEKKDTSYVHNRETYQEAQHQEECGEEEHGQSATNARHGVLGSHQARRRLKRVVKNRIHSKIKDEYKTARKPHQGQHVEQNKQNEKTQFSYLMSEGLIATAQCVVLGHTLHVEVRDAIQARLAHDERNNSETGQQSIRHQLQEAAVRLGELGQLGGVGIYGAGSGDHLAQQEGGACKMCK